MRLHRCEAAVTHEGEAVTHVPLGTTLSADGQLHLARRGGEASGEEVDGEAGGSGGEGASDPTVLPGPPVDRVVLATGYLYSFPFLDEQHLGMRFRGERFVTPLYQHLMHAHRPTLGFIGVPLAVPCPIPFFECQAAYLAEAWARPPASPLTTAAYREAWVKDRIAAVGADRPQDLHFTSAGGASPWGYMRELLGLIHAVTPPTPDGESWVERSDFAERLATVESVYDDRGARYPKKPWHEDDYRRCQYSVDWASGTWAVDDSKARRTA